MASLPLLVELFITPHQHSVQGDPNTPLLQMQVPWHNPLLQTEPKVLRKLLQLLQIPLHFLHKIHVLRP